MRCRQIWGQITYTQRDWGFATNGSNIIVYVRTGEQELTLGDLLGWTNPDVYQILAGLCFASVDQGVRGPGLNKYICAGSIGIGTPYVEEADLYTPVQVVEDEGLEDLGDAEARVNQSEQHHAGDADLDLVAIVTNADAEDHSLEGEDSDSGSDELDKDADESDGGDGSNNLEE